MLLLFSNHSICISLIFSGGIVILKNLSTVLNTELHSQLALNKYLLICSRHHRVVAYPQDTE